MASDSRVRILDLNNLRSVAAVATAINDQLDLETDDLVLADADIVNANLGGQMLPLAILTLTPTTEGVLTTASPVGNYIVALQDDVIFVDESGGAAAVTLPDPATNAGYGYRVMNMTGTNTVTVAGAAGNINGAANDVLAAVAYTYGYYISDGANYFKFSA